MIKFLTLKSLAASAMVCGLLLGVSAPSFALQWAINVDSTTTWTSTGIDSNASQFVSNLLPAPSPQTYVTPSGVTWGTLLTSFGVVAPTPDDMPSTPSLANINFSIDQAIGPFPGVPAGAAHSFTAFGHFEKINAATPGLQLGQSNTRWILESIVDNTVPAVYTAAGNFSLDPLTGAPSILFTPVINGTQVNAWMEAIRQLPIPGGVQTAVLNGYIADVPEPGTVALLVGSGIGGSLMLRRRRRA